LQKAAKEYIFGTRGANTEKKLKKKIDLKKKLKKLANLT